MKTTFVHVSKHGLFPLISFRSLSSFQNIIGCFIFQFHNSDRLFHASPTIPDDSCGSNDFPLHLTKANAAGLPGNDPTIPAISGVPSTLMILITRLARETSAIPTIPGMQSVLTASSIPAIPEVLTDSVTRFFSLQRFISMNGADCDL